MVLVLCAEGWRGAGGLTHPRTHPRITPYLLLPLSPPHWFLLSDPARLPLSPPFRPLASPSIAFLTKPLNAALLLLSFLLACLAVRPPPRIVAICATDQITPLSTPENTGLSICLSVYLAGCVSLAPRQPTGPVSFVIFFSFFTSSLSFRQFLPHIRQFSLVSSLRLSVSAVQEFSFVSFFPTIVQFRHSFPPPSSVPFTSSVSSVSSPQ